MQGEPCGEDIRKPLAQVRRIVPGQHVSTPSQISWSPGSCTYIQARRKGRYEGARVAISAGYGEERHSGRALDRDGTRSGIFCGHVAMSAARVALGGTMARP